MENKLQCTDAFQSFSPTKHEMLAGENMDETTLHMHLDGKTLANQWMIAKFTNVFPRHNVELCMYYHSYLLIPYNG